MSNSNPSLRSYEIISDNDEIPISFWGTEIVHISPHIALQKAINNDGYLALHIITDDETGIDEIKENWYLITAQRRKIQDTVGFTFDDYLYELLVTRRDKDYSILISDPETFAGKFTKVKKKQPSFQELTLDANFDALIFVECIARTKNNSTENKFARHLLKNLLSKFNIDDIDDRIDFALLDINMRKCPWKIDKEPITPTSMREKIRYIENQLQKGLKMNEKPFAKNNLDKLFLYFLVRNDLEIAKEILSTTYPKIYKKYNDRLAFRINTLLTN